VQVLLETCLETPQDKVSVSDCLICLVF
jgi:hypothetical protein